MEATDKMGTARRAACYVRHYTGRASCIREWARPVAPAGAPNEHGYRWLEANRCGLRVAIENAGDVPGYNNHSGWYLNEDCMETVHGAVLLAPGGRYLAAVADPWNEGHFIVDMDAADDADNARSWADSMAERYAEDERAYQEQEFRQRLADDARDVIARIEELERDEETLDEEE